MTPKGSVFELTAHIYKRSESCFCRCTTCTRSLAITWHPAYGGVILVWCEYDPCWRLLVFYQEFNQELSSFDLVQCPIFRNLVLRYLLLIFLQLRLFPHLLSIFSLRYLSKCYKRSKWQHKRDWKRFTSDK